ncbi:MAG: GTP-binding protein, partial [Chloroflexota bacterium]|nr:GTP-binding protein [Chloroflexota bacterium]
MKEYQTKSIRNIVLASHSSAGKTMLVEALANFTGVTTRMGQVEDGSTIADHDDEEIRRGISLFTSVVPIEYNNIKLNFFDTPGYTDFIGEVISAMRVADGTLILVDSVAGLEVGTEMALQYSDQFELPKMILI